MLFEGCKALCGQELKGDRKATRLTLWGRLRSTLGMPGSHALSIISRLLLGLNLGLDCLSTQACFAIFEHLKSDSRGPYSKLERLAIVFLISDEYDINP